MFLEYTGKMRKRKNESVLFFLIGLGPVLLDNYGGVWLDGTLLLTATTTAR